MAVRKMYGKDKEQDSVKKAKIGDQTASGNVATNDEFVVLMLKLLNMYFPVQREIFLGKLAFYNQSCY